MVGISREDEMQRNGRILLGPQSLGSSGPGYIHAPNWHPCKNANIHSLHCLLTCDGVEYLFCDKIQQP